MIVDAVRLSFLISKKKESSEAFFFTFVQGFYLFHEVQRERQQYKT